MALVATVMAKKSPAEPEERRPEPVSYASVKIDDELPLIIREAAAKLHISVQEYMSKVLNEATARDLDRDPIQRRTPRRGR